MRVRRNNVVSGTYTHTTQTRDWQSPRTATYVADTGLDAFFSDPVQLGDSKTPLPYNFVVIRRPSAFNNAKIERYSYGAKTWWTTSHLQGAVMLPMANQLPTFAKYLNNGQFRAHPARKNPRCEVDALNKLADQKMDIATTLAESFETANHLADRSIKLFRALLAIKRGKFTKAARAVGLKRSNLNSKVLAERWLESQYAIKPLLSDIHNVYTLHKEGLRDPSVLTVSSSSSFPETKESVDYFDYGDTIVRKHASIKDQCKLFAQIVNPELMAKSQLGLVSPSVVAWELVPFSFVFDWFIPVGDVLKAWSASTGLKPLKGYFSTYVVEHITYEKSKSFSNASYRSSERVSGSMNITSYSRIVTDKWPRPLPYWDADLSVNNYATLASLYQVIGAKKFITVLPKR